ncbi:MAG: CocE/NonD family hydrolase [Candidatus Eremiobacterota bacterium]
MKTLVCVILVSIFIITGCFEKITPTSAAPEAPSSSDYNFKTEKDYLEMSDGVNLSVTYFMPVAKEEDEKFPVLLEMNPYRKDDMSYMWDYPIGAYFARRGYAVARVDIRGTGSSEGILPEAEYTEQELSDGVEIIDLLSKKTWSNGNVGMYGISWSGFNALMIAARKPPALKAILIAHASDDLYYQDIHYIDGVLHMDVWESMIDSYNALPVPGDYTFTPEYFKERFDREPWHFIWKENQCDGPFWRKESLRFRPDVEIPVYIIGGLLDGYRDTVARLLDSSNKNVKGDIGPWKHEWPDTGTPGPNYEWRQKAVRWWDYWLKGTDNGIMDEPRFMVFVRDGCPPSCDIQKLPGEWRCGDWPVGGIEMQRFYPGEAHNLSGSAPDKPAKHTLAYKAGAGTEIHTWWGELSGDMAGDDKNSVVYDSEPLTKPVEIIGFPQVHLKIAADAPLYQWTVRLEDVWPDGQVSLVSGVLINPADRISRMEQKPLVPGEPAELSGEIHYSTWRFKAGHRIRLAVSNAQFPMGWPTPYKGKTSLFTGAGTWIELPVVTKNTLTGVCDLPEPEEEEYPEDTTTYKNNAENKEYPINYNPDTGESVYGSGEDEEWNIGDINYCRNELNTWKVNDKDPAHASYKAVTDYDIYLPDRNIRLTSIFNFISDEKTFKLTVTRQLFENEEIVREKKWSKSIPRQNQ